jgi:hypothetical protein
MEYGLKLIIYNNLFKYIKTVCVVIIYEIKHCVGTASMMIHYPVKCCIPLVGAFDIFFCGVLFYIID